MTKRFHAGRASQSGVIAAYLAQRGFTGSLDAIEAPFGGFMSTLHGQSEPATILDELGSRWEGLRVGFKAYAACASAHTTIDSVRELRRRGLDADNLEKLTVRMSNKGFLNIGWPYRPAEVITAQMNGSYAAAVTLLDGDAFIEQYTERRLADPAILALLPRIVFLHDPALDQGGAAKRHAVKIEAVCKDGTVLTAAIEQRRGAAEHPLSSTEIIEKFRKIAAVALAPQTIDAVIDIVNRIDRDTDLRRLTNLIGADAS
jgi:2-methylcitrate dehydratase PrpD